jgi:hypothetical protein
MAIAILFGVLAGNVLAQAGGAFDYDKAPSKPSSDSKACPTASPTAGTDLLIQLSLGPTK